MVAWKEEIYEEMRANFISWKADVEEGLHERNKVIMELRAEIATCKKEIELLKGEDGEIKDTVPVYRDTPKPRKGPTTHYKVSVGVSLQGRHTEGRWS